MKGRSPAPRRLILCGALLLSLFCTELRAQVWIATGFDGMSQQYYLATIDTNLASPDELLYIRQTASELNEGRLSLRTRVGSWLSWDQTTALTSLSWQHRTALVAMSDRTRKTRGVLEYRLDWKSPHDADEAGALSNFAVHEAEAAGEHRFGNYTLRLDGYGEWVHYPDPGDFAYDYTHYRGGARLNHSSDLYHFRELRLTLARREVPDSARVSYHEAAAQINLGFTVDDLHFDATLEGADRRYDTDEGHVDYSVGRLHLGWRDAGFPARWSGILEAEGYDYQDPESPVSDFVRVIVRPRRAFPVGASWSPFVEPGLEAVFADADLTDENYFEPRLAIGSDYFDLDNWWVSGDVSAGYRNYRAADQEGLTDYWRFGVSLLLDGKLSGHLGWNLLLAQEWEWHANSADDISVTLFTTGLSYRI